MDRNILANLNRARRSEDVGDTLWRSHNRVQESLMRGGFVNGTTNRRAREITNINTNLQINTDLWALSTEFAQAVQN